MSHVVSSANSIRAKYSLLVVGIGVALMLFGLPSSGGTLNILGCSFGAAVIILGIGLYSRARWGSPFIWLKSLLAATQERHIDG